MPPNMRSFFLVVLVLLSQSARAYNYNEHKAIGNSALTAVLTRLVTSGYFADSAAAGQFLASQLNLRYDASRRQWLFQELSRYPNAISYGDLNGIAGDHEGNPLQLAEGLAYNYSVLNRIVQLQDQYGLQFYTAAPDKVLLNTDFQYGLLALTNFNHFYAYGKSMTWHLETVERQDIIDLLVPANSERVFTKLKKSNAIRMYVTLHAVAIQLAQQAGQLARQRQAEQAQRYLFYAVLYSAFADHFAEDMCAAGHMVVRRSLGGGITNNKALHDFYNNTGLKVVNLKGDIWQTNGDGTLNVPEDNWKTTPSFAALAPVPITTKFQQAINVVSQSLYEVLEAYFVAARTCQDDFVQSLPPTPSKNQPDLREAFYLKRFGALTLVPLPLGSDIKRYFEADDRIQELTKFNRMPYYRNYVRTRVANSVILSLGQLQTARNGAQYPTYAMSGARLILSSKHYNYHHDIHKAGTFDTWQGLTASFSRGQPVLLWEPANTSASPIYQFKGGASLMGDLWVTNNSYVGVHSYLETGFSLRDGRAAWLVSPSLGIQYRPFVSSQSDGVPRILFRALQFVIPQKWVVTYQFVSGQPSQLMVQAEFDINI